MPAHDREPIRRSIEVEYWVVDEAGELVPPEGLVEASPGAEREFVEPLLEIKTTPCETTAELREELLGRLRDVLDRADELGMGLVPLGTPLSDTEISERPDERTRVQNRVVGERFEYVRHCAGTHVHVEQQPGREIDQLNALIALDPALALVNSTPYFRGRPIARGARSKLYRWKAYEGLAHQGQLWPYVSDRDEWDERLENRYGEFLAAATAAGIDRGTVTEHFDPESAVWTPVQLRETFGTVEWRSPDATLPSQLLRLADRIVSIVGRLDGRTVRIGDGDGWIDEDAVCLPEFATIRDHVTAAVEDGLADDDLTAYLERMGFDVSAYEPLTREFDERTRLTDETARQLRLEYASRLERDVKRIRLA